MKAMVWCEVTALMFAANVVAADFGTKGGPQPANIDEIANEDIAQADVEILSAPLFDAVLIDVRTPLQIERNPLRAGNVRIENIPFYELQTKFAELDKTKTYLLYCDKGVMSKLHAAHLVEQGYRNVKVYRPA